MAAAIDEESDGVATQVPLRRMADAEEVSNLVPFLASDESPYSSGMEHVIVGGLTAS